MSMKKKCIDYYLVVIYQRLLNVMTIISNCWGFIRISMSSVKDGVIRQYKGQRTELEIVSFIRDELWKETEPVPWYISPTSIQ